MKKMFTLVAACAMTLATFTVSAGTPLQATRGKAITKAIQTDAPYASAASRAIVCDTLINVSLTQDTAVIYLLDTPGVGYFSGNGAISGGPSLFPIGGVAEKFTTVANSYVTTGFVFFGVAVIKSTDSATPVTAYVYDNTGTGVPYGDAGSAGNKLDSASTTLGQIARNVGNSEPTFFTFTHHTVLPANDYFVGVNFPLITGDTLAVLTNTGNTPRGRGYVQLVAGPSRAFAPYDSAFSGQTGLFVGSFTCSGPLGIANETVGVTDFSVFPNPTNGVFTASVSLESASDVAITITDMTGNKVYESSDKAVKDLSKQINLSSAASGVYVVNVKTANGSVNKRITIN